MELPLLHISHYQKYRHIPWGRVFTPYLGEFWAEYGQNKGAESSVSLFYDIFKLTRTMASPPGAPYHHFHCDLSQISQPKKLFITYLSQYQVQPGQTKG